MSQNYTAVPSYGGEPYTYQQSGDNGALEANQPPSAILYPPMPNGYQQYAAPPIPPPGQPGYYAAPQYTQAQGAPYTYYSPVGAVGYGASFASQSGQPLAPIAEAPKTNGSAAVATPATNEPPSVFDLDPSAVKRPAYFTDVVKPSAANGNTDMNTVATASAGTNGQAPPVVGYIVTLPLAPAAPTMGIPVNTMCCAHCNKVEYTGRVVHHNSKLSIVPPTASMSGQDALSVPLQSLDAELFRPCLCPSFYHRGCFRDMRVGLTFLKSRQYYECPRCDFTYKLERIMGGAKKGSGAMYGNAATQQLNAPNAQQTMGANGNSGMEHTDKQYSFLEELPESNVRGYYYKKIAIMWGIAIVLVAVVVAVLSGISYSIDKDNKNIPVFIKMMFSSVAFKYPSSEDREEWRINFRKPDVKVWPYYLGFAVFLSACGMIIVGLFSYLWCADTNDKDIRPSCCGFICDGDEEHEREINGYLSKRQQLQSSYARDLPPPVQAAVVQRQQRRAVEVRDHYYRQRKISYWFSCSDNSSYYYYDSRPYYYRRRANYYDNRYNGHGRHYYSNGYYYGSGEACCDLCTCCVICCCDNSGPSHRHHHHGGGYNTHAGGGHSTISSSDCDCGNCDCNCSGNDCKGGDCKCEGEGAAALLVLLLVVVIIIIVSAYVTLLCYLVSRSFRLMSLASKLAYVQSLEEEDHVFVLGINESWRPVGTV